MIKSISLWLQSFFYLFAGVNHFINPQFYLPLIPSYLPFPGTINLVAGIVEIALGSLLLAKKYRYFAALGLMSMLVAFIPSHVYFIEIGSCIPGGLCVSEWVGWARLLLIHPLLIGWVWYNRV